MQSKSAVRKRMVVVRAGADVRAAADDARRSCFAPMPTYCGMAEPALSAARRRRPAG